jgi:dihydrolipoamide dehydrogenase
MKNRFDAIVIGAGPAGEVCAGKLADGGMKVAIAERELVAGECSYWACMPSKTLLRPGEVLSGARRAPGADKAITAGIDVDRVLEWRDFMVSDWDDSGQVEWLDEKGITLLRGQGTIAGTGVVEVDGKAHEADHIVIATGSETSFPAVEGLADLDGVWTNREATGFKELPKRLLILGGGPVGVEIGQALTRLGASVVIVEADDRLLSKEPARVGEAIADVLESEGIELKLGVQAASAKRDKGGFVLGIEGAAGVRGDKILVATGRRPRLDGLGVESVGLDADSAPEVDDRMRTIADGVWAIGDVTGLWPFTHVGKYQARIAALDILGENPPPADYRAVPRVVFTDPQVAAVGETEGELTGIAELASGARSSTYARDFSDRPGFLGLVSDGTKLTGAYAVGPEAGEWLGQATLAIRAEVPLDLLRETIQPFPTFSEAFASALADLG